MKDYFPGCTRKIKLHAAEEFPNESCGVIINSRYVPCKNIISKPKEHFRIDPKDLIKLSKQGKIQAIVHSHNNYPHASKKDMIQQIRSKVPWGIVDVVKGNPRDLFYFGDQLPIQDYVGRPFFHGVYDCYSLARDYYRGTLGIILPEYPREYGWWKEDENMLMDFMIDAGFQLIGNDIKDLRQHDGILAKVNATMINHCGVYIGEGGLLLHHLCLHKISLSRRDPINVYKDYIEHIARHKELM